MVYTMKKIFEIDFDDPSDLKKHIRLLNNRRRNILQKMGYNEIKFNSNKFNIDSILPEIELVFNNIPIENGKHYVYFHCNPLHKLNVQGDLKHLFLAMKFNSLKTVPFYVGKGIGNRYLILNRNDSYGKIRNQISKMNKEIEPIKIIENVSENTALIYENFFMYFLGLKALSNHGMLVNLSENDTKDLILSIKKNIVFEKIVKKNGFKKLWS